MFIINLTYVVPLEVVDQYREAHLEFLNKYYNQSNLIASGPKNPRTGGIILASGCTKLEVTKIIQEDPFYIHNIAEYDLIEFQPTMTNYSLLARQKKN